MANRNIYNVAKETKVNDRYDLTYSELKSLMDDIRQGAYDGETLFNVLCTTFKFGYAMGERATKRALKES